MKRKVGVGVLMFFCVFVFFGRLFFSEFFLFFLWRLVVVSVLVFLLDLDDVVDRSLLFL